MHIWYFESSLAVVKISDLMHVHGSYWSCYENSRYTAQCPSNLGQSGDWLHRPGIIWNLIWWIGMLLCRMKLKRLPHSSSLPLEKQQLISSLWTVVDLSYVLARHMQDTSTMHCRVTWSRTFSINIGWETCGGRKDLWAYVYPRWGVRSFRKRIWEILVCGQYSLSKEQRYTYG